MRKLLHITSGDIAGEMLVKSGITGEVLVWHDVLYDGPRTTGWPDENGLNARALFLEQMTAGGLTKKHVFETLTSQYQKLEKHTLYEQLTLWFDGCLFDQSMLVHILSCLFLVGRVKNVSLLCINRFPSIEPFHGIGQLTPEQLISLQNDHSPVTEDQFKFAIHADTTFIKGNHELLTALSLQKEAPLPLVPPAAARWLQECPDPVTGLGKLEKLALDAIQAGCTKPWEIFTVVVEMEEPPQYWGDITLWAKINNLAERSPPLVNIQGPTSRLPQWESEFSLKEFTITPAQTS